MTTEVTLIIPSPTAKGIDCDTWSEELINKLIPLFDQENLQDALTDVEEQALAVKDLKSALTFFYQTHL
jgi:hypothetical protein